MSSDVLAATRIGAGCALIVFAFGCSIARCGPSSHLRVVLIGHFTAGDGPFLTKLTVYDDGVLELKSGFGKRRCHRDTQAAGQLLNLTRSAAFSSEVSALNADSFHTAPPESEQVEVMVSGMDFFVAIDREPPTVTKFLKEADEIFRRAFGSQYDISLVPAGARLQRSSS